MEMNNPNLPVNPSGVTPQPVSNPVNNQRGLFPIILGALILLILVSGGAYYLGTQNRRTIQPTTTPQNNTVVSPTETPIITQSTQIDEAINWKTYRNEVYGFEMQYPSVWSYNNGPLPYTFYFGQKNYPYDAQMGVWVTPNSNLKDFYQDKIQQNCEGVFLAGNTGWRCEGEQYSETEKGVKTGYVVKHIYIELKNNGKFYFLSISATEQDALVKFKYFNQILSTFKFIEKDENANWKTYESSKMNFSVKVPSDFKVFLDINPLDTPSKDELISNFFIKDANGSKAVILVSIESWTSFINVDKYPKEYTFKESVNNEIEFFKSRLDSNLKREDFILDNVSATKVYYEVEHSIAGEKEKRITVYAQKGIRMYKISAYISPKQQDYYLPVLDQMLSTFKFIKPQK